MGLFHFGKKKKTYKEEEIYDNLYEKVKIENDNEVIEDDIDLDKFVIEEAYKEEINTSSIKAQQTYIESCCEQIVIANNRVDDAKKEYTIVGKYIDDIMAIENAEDPYKSDIQYYAKRIMTLRRDKKNLKASATSISDKKYEYIAAHENEMSSILKDMYDDEQYMQSLKTDIHHIQGEKAALKYEKKSAMSRLHSLRRTVKLLAVLLIATIVMFFIVQQLFLVDMLIPSLALVALGSIVAAFVVVYNQNQEKELKIAEIKLNKAIGLINKHKLKYVNVRSRLDYLYETHGVASSYELNELWRQYLVAKKEREAIMKAADELYKSTEKLIETLDNLKLYDSSVWTSQVEAILEPREMTEVRHALNVRRQKLRTSIDYNMKIADANKEKIKEIIKKNPELAKEVISTIEKYE